MLGAGASIATEGKFGAALRRIIRERQFERLIETGTYDGTGSTSLIAECLQPDAHFISIEVCPALHEKAKSLKLPANVTLWNGLSVPQALLPSAEQVNRDCIRARAMGMDVDPNPGQEAEFYLGEVNYKVEDKRLGIAMLETDYRPQFVMLDSAGHLGFIEFLYLMSMVEEPFVLALDDIRHLKHWRSFEWLAKHDQFKIIDYDLEERHGFCIAEWRPL